MKIIYGYILYIIYYNNAPKQEPNKNTRILSSSIPGVGSIVIHWPSVTKNRAIFGTSNQNIFFLWGEVKSYKLSKMQIIITNIR